MENKKETNSEEKKIVKGIRNQIIQGILGHVKDFRIYFKTVENYRLILSREEVWKDLHFIVASRR